MDESFEGRPRSYVRVRALGSSACVEVSDSAFPADKEFTEIVKKIKQELTAEKQQAPILTPQQQAELKEAQASKHLQKSLDKARRRRRRCTRRWVSEDTWARHEGSWGSGEEEGTQVLAREGAVFVSPPSPPKHCQA